MSKIKYEKPELISLVERDSATGKCGNGSVNVSQNCQYGSTAMGGNCSYGVNAASQCTNGTTAIKRCRTGSSQ